MTTWRKAALVWLACHTEEMGQTAAGTWELAGNTPEHLATAARPRASGQTTPAAPSAG